MPIEKKKTHLKAGKYFMQGDEACAEGAVAAGCTFFAGYPITPASEIMETIVRRFEEEKRVFVQMEDEIASMGAIVGASWTGAKSMTATSGPGFSLKMENLGYATMTETPCVVVDVQRVGPSTGQATRTAQGDLMQARWGTHGEHTIIALSPWSVEEAFYETVRAFNLAEEFRTPVIILMEEATGHLRETVTVREAIEIFNRVEEGNGAPFGGEEPLDAVPPMPRFGTGHRLLVTGSTHDPHGYRKTQDRVTQERLLSHLQQKIEYHKERIVQWEEYELDDAETVLISFGFAARAALKAVKDARKKGIKAGLMRLKTVWPMPTERFETLAAQAKTLIVPEMNFGQLRGEVQRFTGGKKVIGVNRADGEVITPESILRAVEGGTSL